MHSGPAIRLGLSAIVQAMASLLGVAVSNAADNGPPFRDCATRQISYRMEAASMIPQLPNGGTAIFECFDHAMIGSAISSDRISVETLHPSIEAGDSVAFRMPHRSADTWTKRVIGMPGDSIELHDGKLAINGAVVRTDPVESFSSHPESAATRTLIRETLANGRSYLIVPDWPESAIAEMGLVTVPPRHLFVLGDNRPHSIDSRSASLFGFVPVVNLIARITAVEAAAATPTTIAIRPPRLADGLGVSATIR